MKQKSICIKNTLKYVTFTTYKYKNPALIGFVLMFSNYRLIIYLFYWK